MITEPVRASLFEAFRDPATHEPLRPCPDGLIGSATTFGFVGPDRAIVDFVAPSSVSAADDANLAMYNDTGSVEKYRNFLSWLFETFELSEAAFRADVLARLKVGSGTRALVVGCGLGEDLVLLQAAVGMEGELHAQDISRSMVEAASASVKGPNVCFSISNALQLPYKSRYFDVVFHFGGINLFGDIRQAISEMERVCRLGGRVMFGDEGIAPHLRGTEYADILINNNPLWALEAPLDQLPHNAGDLTLTYVLGNCFYLISFTPGEGLPKVNLDVAHAGQRGGSARTRYFGRLEGVSADTKSRFIEMTRARGISAHDLLEEMINAQIPREAVPLRSKTK